MLGKWGAAAAARRAGTCRAVGCTKRLTTGAVAGAGSDRGKPRAFCLTNRSMAGDTDDGGRSAEARSSFSGKRLLAGFPDGETSGREAVAEFVGTVAATGGLGDASARLDRRESNAIAAIEGQTVPFFMTMLTPFSGSSCDPGHEAAPCLLGSCT